MLLLGFLLFPMVLQAETDCSFDTSYVVSFSDNGILKRIEPTCPKFDQPLSLNLANNSLHTLPKFVFSNLTNLRYLCLADNEISNFNDTFIGLMNLDYLDVSNNQLERLEKSYFFGIPGKTNINVKGNSLSSISTFTFHNPQERHEDTSRNNKELTSNDSDSGTSSENSTQDIRVELCFEKRIEFGQITVNSVDILRNQWKPSNGCKKAVVRNNELILIGFRIREFTDTWYRIDDTVLVKKISISFNNIHRITEAMLNSLPETVTTVELFSNKLGSMKEGYIENMNSLATNLTVLGLGNNGLRSTKLVDNLPLSLTELNLGSNGINEIAEGSFSKLKRLSKLILCENQFTVLRYKDLQDLSSLEELDLSSNYLRHIMPDAFLNLRNLKKLNLSYNKLYGFSKDTFRGLNNIQSLNLGWNSLRNITGDTFFNMSDTLSTVILNFNKIKVLTANSFVKVPMRNLSLHGNAISRIEMDAFDLSTLEDLNLDCNKLRELDGDSFKGLPSLKRISLIRNGIEKIDSDFWKHLDNVKLLDISGNLIKTLGNGALSGMSKREEGFVLVSRTPIETIQGGVFSSPSEN